MKLVIYEHNVMSNLVDLCVAICFSWGVSS